MKTYNFLIIAILLLASCHHTEKSQVKPVKFGIYATQRLTELPEGFISGITDTSMLFEKDTMGCIVGYLPKDDSLKQQNDLVMLCETAQTVDPDGNYKAIAALNPVAAINNTDILKAKNRAKTVEIHFTMAGAKKWAEFIEFNRGRNIAFIIDNQVYSLPMVNGKIDNGAALINGISNEKEAEALANALNSSK